MTDSLDPSLAIKLFHQSLIIQFRDSLTIHKNELDEEDTAFMSLLDTLCEDINANDEEAPLGQKLILTMVARYPQLTPQLPRDLFWYFGGDALHYIEDTELAQFQSLEEAFYLQASQQPIDTNSYSTLRDTFFAPTPIK